MQRQAWGGNINTNQEVDNEYKTRHPGLFHTEYYNSKISLKNRLTILSLTVKNI